LARIVGFEGRPIAFQFLLHKMNHVGLGAHLVRRSRRCSLCYRHTFCIKSLPATHAELHQLWCPTDTRRLQLIPKSMPGSARFAATTPSLN